MSDVLCDRPWSFLVTIITKPYRHINQISIDIYDELYSRHFSPRIGSRLPGVEWSRDRWRHVTPKGQTRDPIIFETLYLGNCARWTPSHYGPRIGSRPLEVEWSRERSRHVTTKCQNRDPIIFEAPYLRNGIRWTHSHYRPPIGTRPPGVEWSRVRTMWWY